MSENWKRILAHTEIKILSLKWVCMDLFNSKVGESVDTTLVRDLLPRPTGLNGGRRGGGGGKGLLNEHQTGNAQNGANLYH